jgi:hypothetical protein
MSTAARKARKRAGIKFVRTPKVATPLLERSWFTQMFPGLPGTRSQGQMVPRSAKKIRRALSARGIEWGDVL